MNIILVISSGDTREQTTHFFNTHSSQMLSLFLDYTQTVQTKTLKKKTKKRVE